MKHIYRLLLMALAFVWADVAWAQNDENEIIEGANADSIIFSIGREKYKEGLYRVKEKYYRTSETSFKNARDNLKLYQMEYPQDEIVAAMLDSIYGFLFLVNDINNTEEDDAIEQLEKALLNLSFVKRIGEFVRHHDDGIISSNTLNYCRAFDEYDKAIRYDFDFKIYPELFPLFKDVLYQHATILFLSYLNNLPDTTNLCGDTKEKPAWDTCIGDQQLDRCIDDLNRLIGIEQIESDTNQIDTSTLVLLGECYYYKGEYQKATGCYEKSSIPPNQLDLLAAICFLNSYDTLGINEGEKVDILNDLIIEAYRNDYTLYQLLYRDVADVKIFKNDANDKEIKDSWLKSAHQILLHYIGRSEFEKGLDFWLKIKNNFSFSPILLMDQALCHIYLGDFSAISDFAYAYNLMNEMVSDTLNKPSNDEAAAFKEIKDAYCASAIYCFYLEENYEEAMYHYANDTTADGQLMLAICSQKLAEKESDSLKKALLEENAMFYFHEIIRKEESAGKFTNTPYAYLFLKEPDKAINITERMLKTNFPDSIKTERDSLNCHALHHEAAEIYAQVGDLCKARQHIEKAFEYYNDPIMLALAIKMPLLEPIQDYVEMEVNRYKKRLGISAPKIHREPLVCDIPFKKSNDYTRIVKCWINDSIVEMLFDPGADKCQLNIEATKKSGITCNDIIGYVPCKLANGKVGFNPLVSLKKVKIGDIELENVQAVIDSTADAKILLGCTVLNNLKVEMPSPVSKGMIRLTYIKESIEIPEDKKNTDKNQGE